MNEPVDGLIADRRRQWAQLEARQQMQRVQYALLDFQDYAIRRRRQARQQTATRLHEQQQQRPAREYERI